MPKIANVPPDDSDVKIRVYSLLEADLATLREIAKNARDGVTIEQDITVGERRINLCINYISTHNGRLAFYGQTTHEGWFCRFRARLWADPAQTKINEVQLTPLYTEEHLR